MTFPDTANYFVLIMDEGGTKRMAAQSYSDAIKALSLFREEEKQSGHKWIMDIWIEDEDGNRIPEDTGP